MAGHDSWILDSWHGHPACTCPASPVPVTLAWQLRETCIFDFHFCNDKSGGADTRGRPAYSRRFHVCTLLGVISKCNCCLNANGACRCRHDECAGVPTVKLDLYWRAFELYPCNCQKHQYPLHAHALDSAAPAAAVAMHGHVGSPGLKQSTWSENRKRMSAFQHICDL